MKHTTFKEARKDAREIALNGGSGMIEVYRKDGALVFHAYDGKTEIHEDWNYLVNRSGRVEVKRINGKTVYDYYNRGINFK